MARETFGTSGFADLDKQLADLPNNVAKGGARRGIKRGGEVMAAEQRSRAIGGLKNTIVVSAKARNLTGLAEYGDVLSGGGSVTEARGALRTARRERGSEGTRLTVVIGSTAPHAHLVERGTVERFWKTRSHKSTGVMPMQPFIRPAFDSKWRTMLTAVRDEIVVEIRKAKTRIARKAARG